MPETETVESTTVTTTESEFTDDGVKTTETTTSTSELPATPGPTHCDCEECQQFDEDVAGELASLRERVASLESRGAASDKPTETVVKTTPEVEKERERAEPKRASGNGAKKHAGFWG